MRIASLLTLAVVVAAPAAAEEINRIVLRVNDKVATLRDYDERREARLAAVAAAADLSVEDRRRLAADAGRATLREIFEELLVLSRAQQLRIEATPAKIDRAVDQARRRFGIESDEEFAAALYQSGTTIDAFRGRMARSILLSEVIQREVSPRVQVEDEEAARYWREHPEEFRVPERRRVEEAVVRDDTGRSSEEIAAAARSIRDALIAGGTVAEAAAGAGDDVLVLDHGWIERGTLDATLEAAVWELGAGGVAGPLPARGGLHVLHLREIQPSSQQPLEEVRPQILAGLQNVEFDRLSLEYLEELAQTAYIVERLPEEAIGYRDAVSPARDPLRDLLRGGQSAPAQDSPAIPAEEPDSAPQA